MLVEKITDLIGNTPVLKISSAVTGLKNIDLYAKLEMMNPFGSVKDRTVWGMIKDDLEDISRNGMTIYENSSGNTAKSLAAIASLSGVNFKLVSSFKKVKEQKELLQIMGAEIQEVVNASNCFDPTDPNDPQYIIERAAAETPGKVYFPSQFTNRKNPEFHEATTAQEIIDDLGSVDYFFGGLGTTGSSLGVATRLRSVNPDFKAIGITAANNHFIPGIRSLNQMAESELFQKTFYVSILSLTETDALNGMLALAKKSGVLAGPSSGANYHAALEYLRAIDQEQGERKKAVFVVCDRMEWYISYIRERMPELFGEENKPSRFGAFRSEPIDIVPEVMAAEIGHWKKSHPVHMIIDTRVPQSFGLLSVPDSVNMPQDTFERWIENGSPFSEGMSVLIICAIGERSRHYAAYLNSLGVKAYNLSGGIMTWSDLRKVA